MASFDVARTALDDVASTIHQSLHGGAHCHEVRRCRLTLSDTYQALGSGRLISKCDKLLSSFAFNFNLRRFMEAVPIEEGRRTNLIMWCRSGDVRRKHCTMCGRDKTTPAVDV
jgi:hypothetical protein